jgi:NAD(P)-dependent dehydrogenase (short-subunit alcohol dehydrogenase family)
MKTWLITGTASGLGRSIAETVLENGDRLVATARDTARLEILKERYGDAVVLSKLNVADGTQAREAVQLAVGTFGSLDVLVNNAGFSHLSPFEQTSEEDFKAQIDTNLYGVVNLMRAAVPVMRNQQSGHIINISSAAGRVGMAGQSAYSAAKFAVGGLTEAVASEVAAFGVKVIAVEPGSMRTNFGAVTRSEAPMLIPEYEPSVGGFLKILEAIKGNEIGDPLKVAKVVFELSREEQLPRHLVVGSDALHVIKGAEDKRLSEAEKWAEVSSSADADGADLSALSDIHF